MIFLDSDHASVLLESRHALRAKLVARFDGLWGELAMPIVVAEEQLRGWLSQIHRIRETHRQVAPYQRLRKLLDFLGRWPIVDWNDEMADRFESLRAQGLRIGSQDLKIACQSLVSDALLLSANIVDFSKVPGLRVEDWLYSADENGRS